MNFPLHRHSRVVATSFAILCLSISQPGAFAQGKDMSDQDFSAKDFTGQDLHGTNFNDATLKNTKFEKANLQGANFTEADLTGANMTGADLTGANLQDAIIPQVYFYQANLSKANFRGTRRLNIGGVASLRATDLRKIELSGSASGIDFREADLRARN